MTSQELYRALQYVDDAYLESAADSMERRPRPRFVRRWALAAACLLLVCAVALVPTFSRLIRGAVIDAADVASVFGVVSDGAGTSSYRKVYAPNASALSLSPLPDAEYLTVYEYSGRQVPLDLARCTTYTSAILTKISDCLGIPLPDYEIKQTKNGCETSIIEADPYYLSSYQSLTHETVSFSCTGSSPRVVLDGVTVSVCQTQSDEQIIASLSAVRDKLFALFDVSFTDVRVVREYGDYTTHGVEWLTVYFYNAAAHPLNDALASAPYTDYLALSFDNFENFEGDAVSDDILYNVSVRYQRPRSSAKSQFQEAGKKKMLPLEEAEALLQKGYTFGNHVCALCMAAQKTVDFSDYDYVSFEYVYNATDGERGLCLPFYTFYKDIGEAKNGNRIYAKTYVPAVSIRGVEEYFEAQKENHPAVSVDDRIEALETLLGD